MHVKKSTNACKGTYSSTPLTDYRSNQRLLRTRICITFCAFTSVHGVYASPFFSLCIAYMDRLPKMLNPKHKYRESALSVRATRISCSPHTLLPPPLLPPTS